VTLKAQSETEKPREPTGKPSKPPDEHPIIPLMPLVFPPPSLYSDPPSPRLSTQVLFVLDEKEKKKKYLPFVFKSTTQATISGRKH
jgi:hypothetical protein